MDVACALFSLPEIEDILKTLGFEENDPGFRKEMRKRFRPVEGFDPPVYVEREDWDES